jgi:dihydrolipoamide dehydrogenase
VILVAVGRRPYSTGLGLAEIGIQMNKGMVNVDGNFHTSLPHIYAIGDLIDGPMLAHKASEEGFAVAEIIAGHSARVNYIAIPNVIYTHPEVAALGMTEKEAREAGLDVVVGTAFFRGNARARCNGYVEGFVKIIGAGPKKHLVGMHIIGAQASEMIHAGMMTIDKMGTVADLANAPFGHPTLSESIKEACQNIITAKK